MKLVELKGLFQMDAGAPSPLVISNDSDLFLSFYASRISAEDSLIERNIVYDEGVVTIRFVSYVKFSFGFPNNETIHGHPYHKLGLKSYSFYELVDSDLIKQLEGIDSVHPYHNSARWKNYKHYIMTFHDNIFECVAKRFESTADNVSLYDEANRVLRQMAAKYL